jgi:hypothetical protein
VAFIVVDAYTKEGETIAISVSISEPLLYYCQTRQGLMFQKWLPAPTADRRQYNTKLNTNETIQRINSLGSVLIEADRIYSSYRGGEKLIYADVYSWKNGKLSI